MDLHKIIKACINKDESAEKQFYFHYAKKVYGICRRYSSDDQQAEDYMQDGFMKVFLNLSKFNSDYGVFDAWLSRVVINSVLSEKRKKRVDRTYTQIDENFIESLHQETSDDLLNGLIEPEDLLRAIRKMPEKYQLVLNLYVFENLSHKEIAGLLDIEESSSRSRFSRAKKLLKTILLEELKTLT